MMRARRIRVARGLTLVELMIVVAVVAIIAMLAGPGFRDFILLQRLEGVHAQLLTDLQFARSEAASRGQAVNLRVSPPTGANPTSCYIFFTDTAAPLSNACHCHAPEAARCSNATSREIRTVSHDSSRGVSLSFRAGQADHVSFDPVNGSILTFPSNIPRGNEFEIDTAIDGTSRRLRVVLSPAGRPTSCVPAGSNMSGTAC
ncbi:MAG: GspH/FimT family pseudopilin [Burkholderiales bacterium]|nr:GspH/FimT family pseudopilin [Burkholderiales bacterium]